MSVSPVADTIDDKLGWWRSFALAMTLAFRPRSGARRIDSAQPSAWWLCYLLGALCVAAACAFFIAWKELISDLSYRTTGARDAPLFQNTFGSPPFAGLAATVLAIVAAVSAAAAFLAWLLLPEMHRSGSLAKSYIRVLKTVASGVWLLLLLLVVFGVVCVGVAIWNGLASESIFPSGPPTWFFVILIAAPLAIIVLVLQLRKAVKQVADAFPSVGFSPVCEGCGYDLTHRPAHGSCSECGTSLDDSLAPQQRRRGVAWESQGGLFSWCSATVSVILSPRRFYERLQLRTSPRPSGRFAFWHYALMSAGAALWIDIVLLFSFRTLDREEKFALVYLPCLFALIVPLIGWTMKRTIAALCYTVPLLHGEPRDGGWLLKVLAYETAYLWLFCVFHGLFFSSMFVLRGRWIGHAETAVLGHHVYVLGMGIDQLFYLSCIAGLCLIWLLRYRIILRVIRWSNF